MAKVVICVSGIPQVGQDSKYTLQEERMLLAVTGQIWHVSTETVTMQDPKLKHQSSWKSHFRP